MADNQAPASPAVLPPPQEAYDLLVREVGAEAFFTKLASYGIVPANQAEAQSLLSIAGQVRELRETPAFKQAAASDNPYAVADAALRDISGATGLTAGVQKAAQAQAVEASQRAHAIKLASDNRIYNSVLSLKAAQMAAEATQTAA